MTYEVYKEHRGKLTKVERARFRYFEYKFRDEEEKALLRQTGIDGWVTRARILNKGDTVGLLYDQLQRHKARLYAQAQELREKEYLIQAYKDREPWRTNDGV